MSSADWEGWVHAVKDKHENLVKYRIWEAIPAAEVPVGGKVLTSTWAMKKKANGTLCARLNA